jgi:KUP system potassium uptake protein
MLPLSVVSNPRAKQLSRSAYAALVIGAIGVVFGDIGTSPLYALKESFAHLKERGHEVDGVYVRGILSLAFWLLVLVVNVKYIFVITRASNRGEGGIFALLSLIPRGLSMQSRRSRFAMTMLAIAGAGLLFGDGIITPSISVLSAMEGLEIANPGLEWAVIPATLVILVALFYLQQFGTARIATLYGPVMVVWFLALSVFGVLGIMDRPEVLASVNPLHAWRLIALHPFEVFLLLGLVVLCVTGAEALYADMGHFGIKPIRMGWYLLVGPALVITYFGQGAAVLVHLEESGGTIADGFNPFYALIPKPLLYPMVCMAAMATVIASQAMISGVFSLARQAIRLSMLPRLEIVHTSGSQEGQIYLPALNGILLVGCLFTVLLFPSSSQLANAYGIAVTLNMLVTTIIFSVVARRFWRWRRRYVLVVVGAFLVIDVLLAGSNFIKVVSGGWFTLAIALFAFVVMTTWVQGSFIVGRKLAEETQSIHEFLAKLWTEAIPRVPGTAVFLTTNYNTPLALRHFVEHAHVLHEQVVLMTIVSSNLPVVPAARQVRVEWLPDGVWKITALCGFMESPNIPRLLERARQYGFSFDPEQTTYFARRTSVVPSGDAKMAGWRKRLYSMLARNSADATRSFNLPPDRVVDFGAQVEL